MDELSSALLRDSDLRVVVVTATSAAREAARRHKAARAAAGVLAQGLSAALLLGALQKERTRINIQLECGGPLRGMFLDADNEGNVRGYVKNPFADVEVASAEYRYRPVLGNSGYLSVLRDRGEGDHYRSAVELTAFELGRDFERYFHSSDQVESLVRLEVIPEGDEPLGIVAGLLVQPLPGGDREALERLRVTVDGEHGFAHALRQSAGEGAHGVLKALFSADALEMMARYPVQFRCRCTRERVMTALATVGKAELDDMIEKDGRAQLTCDFCETVYEVSLAELRALRAELGS